MRRKLIAGNWKMYHNPVETVEYFKVLKDLVKDSDNEIVICVPYIDAESALQVTEGTNIEIGTQNLNHEEAGALTGDISCKMLQDIGIKYSIIGHSERRQYHHETDDFVNLKIKSAFDHNITPILCVGETLFEREKKVMKYKICMQIAMDLDDLSAEQVKNMVIAYEPIWAIGTGKTATSEDANQACKWIRDEIRNLYGDDTADSVRILYGGSVKPSNAKELFEMPDIDGGLVGGASLNPDDFAKIVNYNM